MLENGYVTLPRLFFRNWEWSDDANTVAVFVRLLIEADIVPNSWHGIPVPRGGMISSYARLAEKTGLSVKKVRTAIKHLEAAGCVAKTAYPNCTVFAIKNFDLFQAGASLRSNEGQTMDKPTASNGQQNKKIEEDKEDIYLSIYLRWRIKRKSFNFSTISTTTNAIRGQTVCRAERHPYRCAKVLQLLQRTWMENQERSADYKLERHTGLLGQDRRNLSGQAKAGNLCFRECSSL